MFDDLAVNVNRNRSKVECRILKVSCKERWKFSLSLENYINLFCTIFFKLINMHFDGSNVACNLFKKTTTKNWQATFQWSKLPLKQTKTKINSN